MMVSSVFREQSVDITLGVVRQHANILIDSVANYERACTNELSKFNHAGCEWMNVLYCVKLEPNAQGDLPKKRKAWKSRPLHNPSWQWFDFQEVLGDAETCSKCGEPLPKLATMSQLINFTGSFFFFGKWRVWSSISDDSAALSALTRHFSLLLSPLLLPSVPFCGPRPLWVSDPCGLKKRRKKRRRGLSRESIDWGCVHVCVCSGSVF